MGCRHRFRRSWTRCVVLREQLAARSLELDANNNNNNYYYYYNANVLPSENYTISARGVRAFLGLSGAVVTTRWLLNRALAVSRDARLVPRA